MQFLTAIYSFSGLFCHLGNVADLQILSALESDILQPSQASKSQHKQMGLCDIQTDTGYRNKTTTKKNQILCQYENTFLSQTEKEKQNGQVR